jgi:hypothetical protein
MNLDVGSKVEFKPELFLTVRTLKNFFFGVNQEVTFQFAGVNKSFSTFKAKVLLGTVDLQL